MMKYNKFQPLPKNKINNQIKEISIDKTKAGNSFIYSFPFWIYADKKVNNVLTIKISDFLSYRIYFPFRQGLATFNTMPMSNIKNFPFINGLPNFNIANTPSITVYPDLNPDINNKFTLHVINGEKFDDKLNPFPFDSIRIDVLSKNDPPPPNDLIQNLLNQVRLRTNQWWINRSISNMVGYIRSSFSINSLGFPVENIYNHAQGTTVAGIEKEVTEDIWYQSVLSAINNEIINLHDSLFLDSQYYSYSDDLKLSILHLAMSCEQSIIFYANKKWVRSGNRDKFKIKTHFPGDDLRKHLDTNCAVFFNESFKYNSMVEFELIEKLWLTRNNVAHGKEPFFYWNGVNQYVDKELNKQFINAVSKLLNWIKSK